VLRLAIGDLGLGVVGFFFVDFFLLAEEVVEAFAVDERVLLAVVDPLDVVVVDLVLALVGVVALVDVDLVVDFLGLGGALVVEDLTGDLDLDRVVVFFFFRFRFNFCFRSGVTLYEALILVRVPSSTPFLRAERK